MEPQNILMGDTNMGIDLPQATVNEDGLVEEKKMARYSKTAEFARIKEHCEERIAFYQSHLPNGMEIGLDFIPSTEDWRVANRIIGEFRLLMNMYENAKDAVDASVSA